MVELVWDINMDTLPDRELPETPRGFKFVGVKIPCIGDYMVDYYGNPYLITKQNKQSVFESHPYTRSWTMNV